MSLFEDLVEELKEENLLEETVIETRRSDGRPSSIIDVPPSSADISSSRDELSGPGEFELDVLADLPPIDSEVLKHDQEPVVSIRPERGSYSPLASSHGSESGTDYFRRRATDEVKTLQMVDHIITRVEKEQAHVNAVPFDDLKVKQALHRFLQLDEEANSTEVAEIEFLLLQETENWYSALTMRDKALTVENLRSYCETAIPSLSAQALLALARFYRNAPFSELVRSKFDLIVTKLYTVTSEEGRREVKLPDESLVADIKGLYKEWSSIPLYTADGTDEDIKFEAEGFDDFMDEARKSHSFDDLVSKDFFKRLNEFKEKAHENFFAPEVIAAAVRCNVAVGNRYLELIENEHGGRRPDELSDKYGFLSDSAISEAIRKVFTAHEEDELAKAEAARKKRKRASEALFNTDKIAEASSAIAKKKAEWYKANKKLVVATALTVLFGIFYFFFSSYLLPSSDLAVSNDVQEINLESTEFKNYVQSARISKDTVYAVTTESWNKLAKPEKEQLMRKFLATGAGKGFSQINFLDSKGKRVGYVSATSVELID